LLDQIPLEGTHAIRLALEQLYGYLVRNAKVYGVLTTMKGWCFVRRENRGRFYITRMFGDFAAHAPISNGAAFEGYYPTTGFSIMQALYYLSAVAQLTDDLVETPIDGVPGEVYLPPSGGSSEAASTILQPEVQDNGQSLHGQGGDGQGGFHIVGGYNQAECCQYHDGVQYRRFQLEPWIPENNLGPKTWLAIALPDRKKVVLKLWDAWKFDDEAQNREAAVYLHLRSLWGKCIPSLLVKSPLEFFHALVLQYVNVHDPCL